MSGIATKPFSLALALFFFTSLAARSQELPDSKVMIDKGVELYDNGKYKEALEYLLKVPEGDTNYATAKYETALTYFTDSSITDAIQTCREGLELADGDKRGFMLLLANSYDFAGQPDRAIYLYDSIARDNPTDNQPVYEKGVVYFRKKEYNKALPLFQQSLLINPYHFRSHFMAAHIYLRLGRMAEAYLAFASSLLFTDDINVANKVISLMSSIAQQTDEAAEYYKQRSKEDETFAETDQIIHAKLPLNKAYKVASVLSNDEVIRVGHAIMEQLKYSGDDTNFVMQFYVPLYQQLFREKRFDPFMLLLFSNYGIEAVEKYVKKEKGDIADVRKIVFPYFDHIVATRVLNYEARQKAPLRYYRDNQGGYIAGAMEMRNNELSFTEGLAHFYDGGHLTSEGRFNKEGKREGDWKYYYRNGALRLQEHYTNGILTGTAKAYRLNGYPRLVSVYNDKGELEEESEYTYNGLLDDKLLYTNGKQNAVVSYHTNGILHQRLQVKDGKVADGKYTSYYATGGLMREMELAGGELNGSYKDYFENGKLKMSGSYSKGKKHGLFKGYYETGQPEYEATYEDGDLEGLYTSYNSFGAIVSTTNYKKGRKHGVQSFFSDSTQYGSITYKNDIPVAIRFTSHGKVVRNVDGPGKALTYYYPNGNMKSFLPLKDGKIEGAAKFYFSTGALREQSAFKNDLRDGISEEYYKTGQKWIQCVYVNGERTGAYKRFYANGQLETEGWLINDKKEGVWKTYNNEGKLTGEQFYLNDEYNGPSRQYAADGRLRYVDYYDEGMLVAVKQTDKEGNILHRQKFPRGNGDYTLVYANGQPYFQATLKNGYYEGPVTLFYFDGSVAERGFFKNGLRDSTTESYYPGGRIRQKGKMRKGQKEGLWQYYSFTGKLERQTNYLHGDEDGTDSIYEDGMLRFVYNMKQDNMEGDQLIYGEDGKIACVLKYKDYDLVAYTYEGKDGNLLPQIPVINGTAKITTYYPNGNKAVELNYVENKLAGTQKIYFSNGQMAEEKTVERLDLNGPFRRYFPNGKLAYEALYKDDELQGPAKQLDTDGNVVIVTNYENGSQHGLQQYNDRKTGKTIKIVYNYGEAINME